MDLLEQKDLLINLFDFYEGLLTDKQREYFMYYYFQDYSLSEIASIYNVSRNAIYDVLRTSVNLLENYESKLKLYEKHQSRKEVFEELKDLDDEKVNSLVDKLKKIELR